MAAGMLTEVVYCLRVNIEREAHERYSGASTPIHTGAPMEQARISGPPAPGATERMVVLLAVQTALDSHASLSCSLAHLPKLRMQSETRTEVLSENVCSAAVDTPSH